MAAANRWVAAALLSSALAACASPSPRAQSAAPAPAAAAPQLVHVTGSLVAVPVDPHTGRPQTASPMQIVTQDDLRNSGYIAVGSALRELVPALQ